MLDIALRIDPSCRHPHQQRLAIAYRLAERILARHGDAVAAIVVVGSTAIGAVGPFSDIDVRAVTHIISGTVPCTGQVMYNSAEALWSVLLEIVEELGLRWQGVRAAGMRPEGSPLSIEMPRAAPTSRGSHHFYRLRIPLRARPGRTVLAAR